MPRLKTDKRRGVMWTPESVPAPSKPKAKPKRKVTRRRLMRVRYESVPPEERRRSIFGLEQDTRLPTQSASNIASWRQAFRDMAVEAVEAEQGRRIT